MVTAGAASSAPASSTSFPCNTCSLNFGTTQSQRAHMKEPWHIYNLQRRMAALPPLSFSIYDTQVRPCATSTDEDHASETDEDHVSEGETESPPVSDPIAALNSGIHECADAVHCIFCETTSPSIEQNLSHMTSTHGFRIPNLDHLTDLEIFLGFLFTTVNDYHECLYCGHETSALGIRQHMISKGHCMMNMDPGSDYLEFWDFGQSSTLESDEDHEIAENPGGMSKQRSRLSSSRTGSRLPSGAVITPRSHHTSHGIESEAKHRSAVRRANSKTIHAIDSPDSATVASTQPPERPSRALRSLSRNERGLAGLSQQQRTSLMVVEKKMLRRELLARGRHRYEVEKGGNKQRYFKPDTPGRSNG